MSYAHEMKSMNCISQTGRMPMCAAPAAAPTMAASEMGVSITRDSPYFASKPSVTLNAPPYAPMSSPNTKTFGSRSISSNSAWRIASRYVVSAIEGPPGRRPFIRRHGTRHTLPVPRRLGRRRIRVHPDERVTRFGHRRLLGQVGGGVDFALHARVDLRQLAGRDALRTLQVRDVPVHRIVRRRPPRDLPLGDVRLVVVLRVSFAAIREQFDQCHTLAATRTV